MASSTELRDRSHIWFERVWNQRDVAAIDEMCQPHVRAYGLADVGLTDFGIPQFKAFHANFCSAFPDLHIKVDEVLVDGERSAVRFHFTGTHRGEGLGVAPSLNVVTCSSMTFIHWQDGKIAEAWNLIDAVGLQAQITAKPAG